MEKAECLTFTARERLCFSSFDRRDACCRTAFSNDVLVGMGWAAVFSVVILAVRYPWCGIILCWLITLAFNKGNYGGWYGGYYRKRRWW